MSNDMKLIMESWRANVIQESVGTKAADEILKNLEDKGQVNEALFTVGALIVGFIIKVATKAAMLSAIAKHAVAAGEGAFNTCIFFLFFIILKSSITSPS